MKMIIISAVIQLFFLGAVFAETLEDAWEIGLRADHELKAAGQDIIARQAELDAVKGGRLPLINIGAGYTFLDNEPASLAGSFQFNTADKKSLSYHAMVSLPLYTHFEVSSLIDAAMANLQAGKLAEQVTYQKVKLQIADTYVAVLLATRQTEEAIIHEQSLSAHVADVQNLHDEGMVPVNDLLAAKVELANAKQITLQTQNRLDIANSFNNRHLGRPLDYEVHLEKIPLLFPETDLATLSQDAVNNRPELAALTEKIDALKWHAKSAKAESGPKISLTSLLQNVQLKRNNQLAVEVWPAKWAS